MALLVWMCFFDRYDFSTQYNYQQEKNKLENEKEFYVAEIDRITEAIHDVKYDHNVIQKIAREKYKMKKDSEDIYIIIETTDGQ